MRREAEVTMFQKVVYALTASVVTIVLPVACFIDGRNAARQRCKGVEVNALPSLREHLTELWSSGDKGFGGIQPA